MYQIGLEGGGGRKLNFLGYKKNTLKHVLYIVHMYVQIQFFKPRSELLDFVLVCFSVILDEAL